jgi:nitroreductase
MKSSWVADVKSLVSGLHGTAPNEGQVSKPYLTEAPWVIVAMKQMHGIDDKGKRVDHYYVPESVGLACGMLVLAIHNAGLVTLTSTPMGAEKQLRTLLHRPDSEKVFLVMPVGYPSHTATVPYRKPERKAADEIIVWNE